MQTGFPKGTVQTLQAHFFPPFGSKNPKKVAAYNSVINSIQPNPLHYSWFTLDLKAMFQINRYLQTGTQQLVIWNSLLAHRSPASSLEPIKTPKGTPRSPLISCFYYFPDTVYPFHPAPHPSLLYWSAAKPWISFSHKNHGASWAGQQLSSAPKHKTSPDWIQALSISFTQGILDYSSSANTSKQAHIRRDIKTQQPRNKLQGIFFLPLHHSHFKQN